MPVPTPPQAPAAVAPGNDPQLAAVIARQKQLALDYRKADDLAAAAARWHVLTLLAPEDDEFRRELAATARGHSARYACVPAGGDGCAPRRRRGSRHAVATPGARPFTRQRGGGARALRDIDKQRLTRIQAGRAAMARPDVMLPPALLSPRAPVRPADNNDAYSLDQRLEIFNAGDTAGGLRELRSYVAAKPNDRAARARIGSAVYEKARELENSRASEQALALYEQAVALRGEPVAEWSARIANLRKTLGEEYYEKGVRAYGTDLPAAIKAWEASLRYDPQQLKASTRLQEAKRTQERLRRIEIERAAN